MILFRFTIALLIIQSCTSQYSQWAVTYHEGQNSGFSHFESDVGSIIQCKQPNISILTSNPYIKKRISLHNFKPFAQTLIAIDYLRPQNIDVQIQIQNKTYDPNLIDQSYQRLLVDDCLGEDPKYIEQSFIQEIFGNSLEEINIIIQAGINDDNQFIIQSDQKIAIKQIHILQLLCPQNCKRCVYLNSQVICTICNQGFEQYRDGCRCEGFRQNDICVEECYDGYVSDQYQICQKAEIINSIKFQQNLRKIYQENEPFELEFDLQSSKTFQIEIEVQIYNFQKLSIFEIQLNQGQYMAYFKIDQRILFGLTSMTQKDCEYEEFCTVYYFKSQIMNIDQNKLFFQTLLKKMPYVNIVDEKDWIKKSIYWKLINLNINILKLEKQIPKIENCIEISNEQQCLKCQIPFFVLDGQCINKCPLQQPKSNEICFDSKTDNLQILQFSQVQNEYQNLNQIYFIYQVNWFYNKELLNSGSMFWYHLFSQDIQHYGITIQSKIIFIDQNDDSKLIISLENGNQKFVISPNNTEFIGGQQNIPDSIVYFNQFIPHNNANFTIEVESQSLTYYTNFVILIHNCAPYCKSCTGPKKSECLEFEKGLKEFDSTMLKCNLGYYETQANYCMQCLELNCLSCTNNKDCLLCRNGCKLTKYQKCICN
ncbi:unnamed protein product [Paramecium sonneborni]|uniref:Uncharacterized protein n=1 Tax=Paramecium sonneborni TaxID=65129 RepID=A0A8S1K6I9_9CILI|nr:unnamed protein product [Paramecium sonneborni]